MITKQDLKIKYGDDITFLFKGEEPFTEAHNNPAGMIIERDGKVLCYECGGWFETLGNHVKIHGMTSNEYKDKYGINRKTGICCKRVSKMRSDVALNLGSVKYALSADRKTPKKTNKKPSMQRRNYFNTCPEQIKERMRMAVSRFGKDITVNQVKIVDSSLPKLARVHFGSWNKLKELMGLEINIMYSDRKKKTDLIYDLREYILNKGKLPWSPLSIDKSFPHSSRPYKHKWGSFSKAYEACGIRKYREGNKTIWEVIN